MSHSGTDVVVVSLGSTAGLRAADKELCCSLQNCGLTVELVFCKPQRSVRTFMLTDLLWAQAARRAAQQAVERFHPNHIIYSSTTAALLWSQPGLIRYDSPSAENRPGRHGMWQRPLERFRLRQATCLLPCSNVALSHTPTPHARAVVVPIPVEGSGPQTQPRDIAAITYGANPHKKGLDHILSAWQSARKDDEELVVAGLDMKVSLPGVRVVGKLPRQEYRSLLRRSKLYISAPRREDYGIAQLEALADGCLLVTTESRGPYVALAFAKQLDQRLVGEDLTTMIRLALDTPKPGYSQQAKELLQPFTHAAVEDTLVKQLAPLLTGATVC